MAYNVKPLLTGGAGESYLISIVGNEIQDAYDLDTGITVAIRVTWNAGHNQLQFPPFFTTLHDGGFFPLSTDTSIEVIHVDTIRYVPSYELPLESGGVPLSRIAPGDTTSIRTILPPGTFSILVCPLSMKRGKAPRGPNTVTQPLSLQSLPPLTCRYKPGAVGPAPHLKPSAYITHACILRQGDAFQASMSAGGGVYTAPGQLVTVSDGIVMTAIADAYAGQVRWFYGSP